MLQAFGFLARATVGHYRETCINFLIECMRSPKVCPIARGRHRLRCWRVVVVVVVNRTNTDTLAVIVVVVVVGGGGGGGGGGVLSWWLLLLARAAVCRVHVDKAVAGCTRSENPSSAAPSPSPSDASAGRKLLRRRCDRVDHCEFY